MEDFSRLGLVYPDPFRRILFLYKLIKNHEEQRRLLLSNECYTGRESYVQLHEESIPQLRYGKTVSEIKVKWYLYSCSGIVRNRIEDDILSAMYMYFNRVSTKSICFLVEILNFTDSKSNNSSMSDNRYNRSDNSSRKRHGDSTHSNNSSSMSDNRANRPKHLYRSDNSSRKRQAGSSSHCDEKKMRFENRQPKKNIGTSFTKTV